jgi:hypothetical protein
MFLNVNPAPSHFRCVDTVDPETVPATERTTMSSLLAERRQPARMTAVRSAIVNALTIVFKGERFNIHSGHPWLPSGMAGGREQIDRAC